MEFWAVAAVTVGTAVVGGAMSARGAQKGAEAQAKGDAEAARVAAVEGRRTTAFEADLGDYYGQLQKQRRRDARAANYAQYSKKPQPEGFVRAALVGEKPKPPTDPVAAPAAEAKKKEKGGFFRKHLDPAGLF